MLQKVLLLGEHTGTLITLVDDTARNRLVLWCQAVQFIDRVKIHWPLVPLAAAEDSDESGCAKTDSEFFANSFRPDLRARPIPYKWPLCTPTGRLKNASLVSAVLFSPLAGGGDGHSNTQQREVNTTDKSGVNLSLLSTQKSHVRGRETTAFGWHTLICL